MLKVRGSVVAFPELYFCVLQVGSVHANRNTSVSPVPLSVAADITQEVIEGCVFVNFREGRRKVIRIKKRPSSCIVCECDQRFLRSKVRIVLAQDTAAGINRISAAPASGAAPASATSTATKCSAAGHHCFEATDVNRIERKVCPACSVDGKAELCLVFNTRAFHSTTEIDDRFSLRDDAQIVCEIYKCLQPAIRVENVVFRFVGSESARGVTSIGGVRRIGRSAIGETLIAPTNQ